MLELLRKRGQAEAPAGPARNGPLKVGLSQWDLMRLKFRRDRLAVISLWVIVAIYVVVAVPEFLSPYPIGRKDADYTYAPPMKIRIFHEGRLAAPFVYGYKYEIDRRTFLRKYVPDTASRHPIRLLVRGEPYKLLGFIPARVRLYGTVDGGVVYLLGTDRFGQDVWSRILSGSQVTLTAGLFGVVISVVLGAILGTLSGYVGGLADNLIQRVIEFLRSFPQIPLWLTLAAALPPTWSSVRIYFGIVTILAFLGWTGLAREVRGKVLTMRGMEYVSAARAGGASAWYIVTRHMMPNALSHIIVVATLAVPGMILGESSLSFLGLGIQPPMTSLGVLLQEAQNVRTIVNYPWLFTPAGVIIVAILAFNFLGDGLRDAADPYSH
jgi:peptide/nickel transport system permease protein